MQHCFLRYPAACTVRGEVDSKGPMMPVLDTNATASVIEAFAPDDQLHSPSSNDYRVFNRSSGAHHAQISARLMDLVEYFSRRIRKPEWTSIRGKLTHAEATQDFEAPPPTLDTSGSFPAYDTDVLRSGSGTGVSWLLKQGSACKYSV